MVIKMQTIEYYVNTSNEPSWELSDEDDKCGSKAKRIWLLLLFIINKNQFQSAIQISPLNEILLFI